MNTPNHPPQHLPLPTAARLLKKPLDEFMHRVDAPANLSRTLNALLFNGLLRGETLKPEELENVHALADFLLACQVAYGATVLVAQA